MNKINQAKEILIYLIILTFFGYSRLDYKKENELIIGTWIEVSSSVENRLVFYENGICEDYDENQIFETYKWEIIENTTQSGLSLYHLILINSEDTSDIYHYEINVLNEEIMIITYQIPEWGFGKPTTYLRHNIDLRR